MADRTPLDSGAADRNLPRTDKDAATGDRTTSYAPTPFTERAVPGDAERTVVQQLTDYVQSRSASAIPLAAGYRLIQPIGEGSFGTVWLAQDKAGVRVAIKFFAHGAGQKWQQLQDEVRSLAQLDTTAGIIPLKEVEPDADPPYFVMSFAEGGSLAQRLEKGPLPPRDALRIFRHIAEALAYVHAKGIRHCDLKPGNILLNQHGQPLIADFGQAHLSDDATPSLGTFFYMAPEQAELDASLPDTRWDVYSLGALFYAMLTGEPPRKAASLSEELKRTEQLHHRLKIYRERIRAMPEPSAHRAIKGVDRPMAEIIDRCLVFSTHDRFRDAGAVLDALETRRRQRRQRPLVMFAIAVTLLTMGLLGGGATWLARSAAADARNGLRTQQLNNNQVTAQLAANVIEEKLQDRVEYLEMLTKSPAGAELPELIAAGSSARRETAGTDVVVPPRMKPLRDWLLHHYTSGAGRYFAGLVAIDPDGYVLARAGRGTEGTYAVAPATLEDRRERYDRSYAWRNWFNGERDYFEDQQIRKPPVRVPLISQPYVGKFFTRGQTLINIAVPLVRDGQVAGLLMGNIEWNDFQRWLTDVHIAGGFAAVANGRGQCLSHQLLEQIRPKVDQVPKAYYADAGIPTDQASNMPDFVDPIDGRTYLAGSAAFRPLRERDERWIVLVQHDPESALLPVTELQRRLRHVGWWCLAIMTVLVGGMWGGLIWLLRREERLAHA